jgi:hypothetical protein
VRAAASGQQRRTKAGGARTEDQQIGVIQGRGGGCGRHRGIFARGQT